MSAPSDPKTDSDPLAGWQATVTLGLSKDHREWDQRQTWTWPEITSRLTTHTAGTKDGICYTPAIFSGTRRQQVDALRIDLVALDIESGAPIETVAKKLRRLGYAAAIHTTYRHMMTETEVSAADFAKFERDTGTAEAPSRYLVARKGMLPAIAMGAAIVDQAEKTLTLAHQPCPRFRVCLPMGRPWIASDYPDQYAALAAWHGAMAALAHALSVAADPTGFEAAHLFYWPRYQPGGVPPASQLITGRPVDLFSLPPAPKAARSYAPRRAAIEVDPDLPGNVTEARRWLKAEARVAVEGNKGDRRTVNIAMELHDRGISEPVAFDLLTEPDGWNDRCDPPWHHDDLGVKIRNGYRYASNDFGCKTARSQGQAAFGHYQHQTAGDDDSGGTGEPTRLDWNWWLARPLPPPEPMLGDLIVTGGFLFLGGATGQGKTQLGHAIAGAVATGTDLMHLKCHGVRRVLVVDGEMPNALVKQRLGDLHRRISKTHAVPEDAPLHVLTRDDFPAMEPLNTEAGRAFILRKIEEIRPSLIVFDSRMCLTLGKLKDEETWASTVPLVMELRHRRLCQVWIDHMGLIADHLYGDSTKEWGCDTVALMLAVSEKEKRKAAADVHFKLKITKARTRTPDNWEDFRDGVVILKSDAWTFKPDGKPAGTVPDWCQPFLKALRNVLGDETSITAPTWRAECERLGYIVEAADGETPKQRENRFREFRTAKSKLAKLEVINLFGDFVFYPKADR